VDVTDPRITFLRARYDEIERIARAAQGETDGRWTQVDPNREPGRVEDDKGVVVYDEGLPTEEQARHIAAHDPHSERVHITALRKIVVKAEQAYDRRDAGDENADYWFDMAEVLGILAEPFATHPDYQKDWTV
jgi:hypothetical protein